MISQRPVEMAASSKQHRIAGAGGRRPCRNARRAMALLAAVGIWSGAASAQASLSAAVAGSGRAPSVSAESVESTETALPDAPSALLQPDDDPSTGKPALTRYKAHQERVASLHLKYIPEGWKVYPLTRHDKVLLGLRDLYNPLTLGTIVISAGYSHLVNGQPNYGVDRAAFAQRVGAAFVRDASQGLFTDAVFAPALQEDPRYYEMGPGHNVVRRALYAITRPLVTRTDGGRSIPNGALLLGYASSSTLTLAYYPQINRNFSDVADTFGSAVGGAALGDLADEFSGEILGALHLPHRE